jgi:hypothetical protein
MNVYLSKSNASSFEVYSLCKQKLLSLGHSVLEFTGGEYTNEELLKADFLFIVPPERIIGAPSSNGGNFDYHNDSEHNYEIGRGQTQQILDFAAKYHVVKKDEDTSDYSIACPRIFVLTEITHRDNVISLYGDQIEYVELNEHDWKEDWSELITDMSACNIEGSLNTINEFLPWNKVHIHKCNPGSNVRDDGSEVITPMLGTIVLYPHITL